MTPAPVRVALLSVGDELLSGDILDTNAHWIANALQARGQRLVSMATVGDRVAEICDAVLRARTDANWLLVTGGLGPTADDLTRDGVAAACGLGLEERPELIAQLEARGMRVTAGARRQAEMPIGATVLANPRGTAPGFLVQHDGFHVAVFPGVPSEMRPMVSALLDAHVPAGALQPPRKLLATGLPESLAGERLGELMDPAVAGCRLGITVSTGIMTVSARGEDGAAMDRALAAARERLGSHAIDCLPGESLPALVVRLATERGLHLSCAESCTGGLLAGALTSVPGSSAVLNESFVTYANAAKIARLGVSPQLLKQHGAVSEEVAAAMVVGCLAASGADLAAAITGVAGPDGGTEAKPVGTVLIAVADAQGVVVRSLRAGGSRADIRARSVNLALDLLRRRMLGLPER